MSGSLLSPVPILYLWPGQWGLPSFDPLCLAAALYLQLALPGKFTVTETSNPDISPSGQLPFLVHGQHVVTSFPSIVKYISGLRNADYKTYPEADLDDHLSSREKAQKIAWYAHAESHLGDLLYHCLYANQDNWTKLTGPTLASMYPAPQKYYVPSRIRDGYHQRLLAAGLWHVFVEDEPTEFPFPKEVKPAEKGNLTKNPTLSKAFNREKVTEKARMELDIYQELLGDRSFIFHDRLSTIDILVAAHIILLQNPPYPDPTLKVLVTESYPSLQSLAQRIVASALPKEGATISTTPPSSTLWGFLPSWPKRTVSVKKEPDPEDLVFTQMRWGFFGLVIGSFAAYWAIFGSQFVQLRWQDAKEHNREDPVEIDAQEN